MTAIISDYAKDMAAKVETFVRDVVIPYEQDTRRTSHGPEEVMIEEMKEKAMAAGVMTPHIKADGSHLTQRETALVLKKSGLSILGPLAVNTAAPDEGNMFLLGKVGSPEIKERFLKPLVEGRARSAFFMTEPAEMNGAGSDPSMMLTTCERDGDEWVINGRKKFISGALGAKVGIVMARSEDGACMFLVDLPNPAIKFERLLDTMDDSVPGGHAEFTITDLRVPTKFMLGDSGKAFQYAQVRLSPARLSHCMRWYGAGLRAHEIATAYACHRRGFGKLLIEHEGVGFMLAENLIDLKITETMIDWCADILDGGELGITESSMTKVACSEALSRIADRCVQIMGGNGVTRETMVESFYREIRQFRIYDGPTEVHKWSIAKRIQKQFEREA